jgi:hypothetical protein
MRMLAHHFLSQVLLIYSFNQYIFIMVAHQFLARVVALETMSDNLREHPTIVLARGIHGCVQVCVPVCPHATACPLAYVCVRACVRACVGVGVGLRVVLRLCEYNVRICECAIVVMRGIVRPRGETDAWGKLVDGVVGAWGRFNLALAKPKQDIIRL